MQKNGAGLHTASSCFWDNTTDGTEIIVAFCCRILIYCDYTGKADSFGTKA